MSGGPTGYYRMHRGWLGHPVFGSAKGEPFDKRSAWCWLVEHAAWRDTRLDILGRTVAIRRGQLCRAHRDLAAAWGWSLGATQRFLARLESESMIGSQTGSGRTIITICKYDEYQGSGRPGESLSDTPSESRLSQDRVNPESQKKEGKEGNQDSTAAAPRVRAREETPPADLPMAPVVPAEAVQIIAAFQAAREAAFGTSAEPLFPNQMDRIDVCRWLEAGAAKGIGAAEMVQIATETFQAVHRRMAARRTRPPRSLAIHNDDIADAIARRTTPLPDGKSDHGPAHHHHAPQQRGGERRTYGDSDPDTRRRGILAGLGLAVGMAGD